MRDKERGVWREENILQQFIEQNSYLSPICYYL